MRHTPDPTHTQLGGVHEPSGRLSCAPLPRRAGRCIAGRDRRTGPNALGHCKYRHRPARLHRHRPINQSTSTTNQIGLHRPRNSLSHYAGFPPLRPFIPTSGIILRLDCGDYFDTATTYLNTSSTCLDSADLSQHLKDPVHLSQHLGRLRPCISISGGLL
ncbi:hypothetical protein NEOLEDRAFT_294116 [Neolentinus lepideus HHB14362 ss-1]|uniref:Uncharacterized protein n=1 Tax=Neolentinus lepideus HHB14362 ss-1 TaxID=1314782 RepID=A0A165T0T4_9AGAM|nr:hypothetical protein NEOLEDRAFT_294116 [Neolentinus lepideus HHB14362 ss-1]